MRQAGGSAATIYSSGGMPVQSAVLNSGTIAAIENADLNSGIGTIPLLRGAFVPRDFGTAIEGVSLLRVPLLGTIDCTDNTSSSVKRENCQTATRKISCHFGYKWNYLPLNYIKI